MVAYYLFIYLFVLSPDFLLANSHPPDSAPPSHDSYQSAIICFLRDTWRQPTKQLLTGQRNTLRGYSYPPALWMLLSLWLTGEREKGRECMPLHGPFRSLGLLVIDGCGIIKIWACDLLRTGRTLFRWTTQKPWGNVTNMHAIPAEAGKCKKLGIKKQTRSTTEHVVNKE